VVDRWTWRPAPRKKNPSAEAGGARRVDHAGDLVVRRQRASFSRTRAMTGGVLIEPRLDLEVDLLLQLAERRERADSGSCVEKPITDSPVRSLRP
jgi:hypothetical protein